MIEFLGALVMYFKRLFLLILNVTFLISCSNPLNEKPPKYVSVQKIGFETQCLSNSLDIMKFFIQGTATESQITGAWNCFGEALSVFQQQVRGSNQNEYNSREIANFFESYFMKGIKLNDSLLLEIMHIKQIVVGGSDRVLTQEELSRLIQFSESMKRISLNLLPYMKVYSLNWKIPTDENSIQNNIVFFEKANFAFQQAADDLSNIIERNHQSYKLDNFLILLEEMQNLYSAQWSWLPTVKKAFPFIIELKGALAGGNPELVSSSEWRRFILLGARGYIQYLRYNYFVTEIPQADVKLGYLSSSLDDVFSYLETMVSQKPGQVLTKGEMNRLLSTVQNIFPDFYSSEVFVDQLMKLKALLFGGSELNWLPSDFIHAKTKIAPVHRILSLLTRKSDFYFLKWKSDGLSDEDIQIEFNQNVQNLKIVFDEISNLIETDYDLNDFNVFLKELEQFWKTSNNSFLKNISSYGSVLLSVKEILLFEDASLLKKSQWPELFSSVHQIYTQVLFFNYLVWPLSMTEGKGLQSLNVCVQNSIQTLNSLMLAQHSSGENFIPYRRLNLLLSGLVETQLLPSGLQAETLQNLIKNIFEGILLKPEHRLQSPPYQIKGFEIEALDVLKSEFNIWYSNQLILESLFNRGGLSSFFLSKNFSVSDLLSALKDIPQDVGVKELTRVFDARFALVLDEKYHLTLSKVEGLYDFNSARAMNLSRSLSRLIIRGYSQDQARVIGLEGINLDEMKSFFSHIKGLVSELGLIDPANLNFASNRFLESNLFTPAADGNDIMSFKEGTHLLIMIFSGLGLADLVEKEILSSCPVVQAPLKFNYKVQVECVLDVYENHFSSIFKSIPEMVKYSNDIGRQKFRNMTLQLLKAAGWVPNPVGIAKFGDVSLVPHVFQYLEVVMARYDLNKDQFINDDEALAAYPNFQFVLQKVSETPSRILNLSIFLYLVKNGTVPPEDDKLKEIFKVTQEWLAKEIHHRPMSINADRYQFSLIFGAIADAVAKTQN